MWRLCAGGDRMMQLYECHRCLAHTTNQQQREPMPGPGKLERVGGCENCRYAAAAVQVNSLAEQYDAMEKELGMVIPPTMRAEGLSFTELLADLGIDPDGFLGWGE